MQPGRCRSVVQPGSCRAAWELSASLKDLQLFGMCPKKTQWSSQRCLVNKPRGDPKRSTNVFSNSQGTLEASCKLLGGGTEFLWNHRSRKDLHLFGQTGGKAMRGQQTVNTWFFDSGFATFEG